MENPQPTPSHPKLSWKIRISQFIQMRVSPRVIASIAGIGIMMGALIANIAYENSKNPKNIDPIEKPYVIPIISYLDFKSLDDQPWEYSHSLELSGEVGSGVLAIEIWSSCDQDTHRLKSFKPNDVAFVYKVSNALGNLCRGNNEYSVRAFGKENGKEKQLATVPRYLNSFVGLRKRADLSLVKFLEQHTLKSDRSIEDSAMLPSRLFPSAQFKEACSKKDIFPVEKDILLKVNDHLGAKFGIENEKLYTGSAATLRVPRIHWFRKAGNIFEPAPVPTLKWSSCENIPGIHVTAVGNNRIIVDQIDGTPEQYFDGTAWTDIRTLVLKSVPMGNNDLGSVRAAVKDDVLAVIEERTSGHQEMSTQTSNFVIKTSRFAKKSLRRLGGRNKLRNASLSTEGGEQKIPPL